MSILCKFIFRTCSTSKFQLQNFIQVKDCGAPIVSKPRPSVLNGKFNVGNNG